MKFEPSLEEAIFVRRYKRFFVDIRCPDGSERTIHCANTGAMRGCSYPNSRAWFSTSNNLKRKLKHSLELIESVDQHLICVNTIRANQVVEEAISLGQVEQISKTEQLRREYPISGERGRFDFGNDNFVIEIKSVTWHENGWGLFPDARSTRASRHVHCLSRCAKDGKRAMLFFCVLHTGVERVSVAKHVDPEYSQAVKQAINDGVEVLAYRWRLAPTEFVIDKEIPFLWDD